MPTVPFYPYGCNNYPQILQTSRQLTRMLEKLRGEIARARHLPAGSLFLFIMQDGTILTYGERNAGVMKKGGRGVTYRRSSYSLSSMSLFERLSRTSIGKRGLKTVHHYLPPSPACDA